PRARGRRRAAWARPPRAARRRARTRRAAILRARAPRRSCSGRAQARAPPLAGARRSARRTGRELRARSASRKRQHARRAFAEIAREDAVVVVIEARPLLQQLRDFGLAARSSQIAPAVHRMHFGGV